MGKMEDDVEKLVDDVENVVHHSHKNSIYHNYTRYNDRFAQGNSYTLVLFFRDRYHTNIPYDNQD